MALGEVEEFATPVPAAPVLTRLGIADTLRSITLASATERESVQEFLPPQRRPRTPVRRAPVESAAPQPNPEEFIERLRHLRSVPPGAVHGPWTLLRAIARTTTGAPRLSQWSEIRQEIGSLVAELTPVGSAAPPKDRFWDLRSSGVWEVHGADAVDGSPLAGLTPEAARLLSDPQTRAEAIAALRGSHLAAVDQHTLLVRLGLGGYDTASGLADETDATDERQQAGPAARLTTTISRPVRDSRLVSTVKRLHGHQCQFCGLRLRTRDGHYSEGAHIRGLGRPHHGPDILANLLCLCPNHHVQFDQLAVYVDEDDIVRTTYGTAPVGQLRRHPEHAIDNAFLGYHRSLCGRNS
ncbi:hypothetical protein C7M71_009515 [Peterkaempfera bronchialis]|uniref:HNH nuclease domain-containing protein n=2 Tax=Peterkaempfera bronchialis TaxID=2126346 RepID=A0A345T5P4_9ACTN|nr:hypothetical protein C7M71_009515 [Peterkaempfera bronchialis]